MTSKPDILAWF
jgi:hypothetical protein